MCTRASTRAVVMGMALLSFALHPAPAAADPVTITGDLSATGPGFRLLPDLNLSFPDFRITITLGSPISPGFSFTGREGLELPFSQTTGPFSGHSLLGNADVSGSLSFAGPTGTLHFEPGLRTAFQSAPVELTGFLRIVQDGHVLFDGSLVGGGTGGVGYEDRFNRGDIRIEGYIYTFSAVAETPEPASLLLLGSGVAWMLTRRRTQNRAPASAA